MAGVNGEEAHVEAVKVGKEEVDGDVGMAESAVKGGKNELRGRGR